MDDITDDWGGIPVDESSQQAVEPKATASQATDNWGGVPINEPAPKEMPWSTIPGKALENAIPSAKQFASDLIQPIIHPIDTAKSLGNLGLGAVEKLIPGGEYPHEKYADAVGEYFINRYGGMENLKKTMGDDPVGFLGDLSAILTGGSAAAARAPGAAGTAARVAGQIGKVIDPIMAPVNAAKAVGEVIPAIAGLATGVGPTAVKTAYQSGVKGGASSQAFLENMRGVTPAAEVVDDARNALRNMRQERSFDYVQGMASVGRDMTVLDFADLDRAIANTDRIKRFGTQDLSPSTAGVRSEIANVISEWRGLDPTQYHTPIGFDALKQRLGDIKDSLPYNTPERLVAEKAYNAARETIVKQAPDYAHVMKGYENASKQIDEVSRTLSLNPKASVDTALRKLQSAIRNNVNTNYGNRTKLAQGLAQNGAPELMEKLSGQAMNTWVPRGLAGIAGLGELYAAWHAMSPWSLVAMPASSPRVVGEGAHLAGRAVGLVPDTIRGVKLPTSTHGAAQTMRTIGETVRSEDPQINRANGGRIDPNNIHTSPSDAQKEAGNYAKDHVRIQGLDLTIENAKGSKRSGVDKGGKPWSVTLPHHYGYIKGSVGADKDHVDCYLGPHKNAPNVWVVDQQDADTKKFDEHKVMLAFASAQQARNCYLKAFSDGRGQARIKAMHEMTIGDFKEWLAKGDTTKAMAAA